jgi:hypothetical protein
MSTATGDHWLPAFAGRVGLVLAMLWLTESVAHERLVLGVVVAAFAHWGYGMYQVRTART